MSLNNLNMQNKEDIIDKDIKLQKKYFEFYQAIKTVKVKYPKNG